LQLDVKVKGISVETLDKAIDQAEVARSKILDVLYDAIPSPRPLSETAPRIVKIEIPVDKIGEVIGPGGRNVLNTYVFNNKPHNIFRTFIRIFFV